MRGLPLHLSPDAADRGRLRLVALRAEGSCVGAGRPTSTSKKSEIEQTSDTLEILERIATIEQQQLEHQRDRVLRDLRGVFFALLVSVAVIVAGLAPLVEATPDDRRLILLWTLVVCVVAGVGYAAVRAWQSSRRDPA